jgi:hypothetical protein
VKPRLEVRKTNKIAELKALFKIAFTAVQYVSGNELVFRPPIIIQLNKTAGCGGPLPARRFPGVRGGAAYIFGCHMVSTNIQGLGLSDKLLEHYKKEIGEMALGILDGKPFDSPIHEGILLTCMLEFLPTKRSGSKSLSDPLVISRLDGNQVSWRASMG